MGEMIDVWGSANNGGMIQTCQSTRCLCGYRHCDHRHCYRRHSGSFRGRCSGLRVARSRRSGFTLIEILLVLSVISVMVAIAVPQLLRVYEGMILNDAVGSLRIRLTGLRHLAIDTGTTMQFRYEPEGGQYLIAPYDPIADDSEVLDHTEEGTLPETLMFDYSDAVTNYPLELETDELIDTQLVGFESARRVQQVKWAPPILFYPDGTATDVRFIVVENDKEGIGQYEVAVRGLTGAVSTTKMSEDDDE